MIKQGYTITQLIKWFLAEQSIKPNSRRTYKHVLRSWFKHLMTSNVSYYECSKSDVVEYREKLLKRSETTALNYLLIIKKFYKWLESEGYGKDIAKGVKNPKRYKGFKKEVLLSYQVEQLLSLPDTSTLTGARDKAILMLLAVRGLRVSSVSSLNVEDVVQKKDNRGRDIWGLMVQLKGHNSKDVFAAVPDEVLDSISDYLAFREDLNQDAPLFITNPLGNVYKNRRMTPKVISKMVKRYLSKMGINSKRITAHSLRHTVAVTMLLNGYDIHETQTYLHHSSPDITMIYSRWAEQIKRLNNAVGDNLISLYNLKRNDSNANNFKRTGGTKGKDR